MPLTKIKTFISDLSNFLKNVAQDRRIPDRDKKVLLALIILVISPIDIIPDWIPIIGLLDDLFIIGIILDYFFEVLDPDTILSHYPWSMKSYVWLRRYASFLGTLTPRFVKKWLWKYTGSPYRS
jgi:uncharacterized membrane protein YkvA (DUF1232 family)